MKLPLGMNFYSPGGMSGLLGHLRILGKDILSTPNGICSSLCGSPEALGSSAAPSILIPRGRSWPSAHGIHKKGHDVSRVLFCGLRGPRARSALRDFNARGGRATPAPRFWPTAKTLVRRTCAAAQKGRLAVLLQRSRPSKISISTVSSIILEHGFPPKILALKFLETKSERRELLQYRLVTPPYPPGRGIGPLIRGVDRLKRAGGEIPSRGTSTPSHIPRPVHIG